MKLFIILPDPSTCKLSSWVHGLPEGWKVLRSDTITLLMNSPKATWSHQGRSKYTNEVCRRAAQDKSLAPHFHISCSLSFTLRNQTTFRKCRPLKAWNSDSYLGFQNGLVSFKEPLEIRSLKEKKNHLLHSLKNGAGGWISKFFPATSKQAIPFSAFSCI